MKALSALGFEVARKHGSHVVMKQADGRITVIPVHAFIISRFSLNYHISLYDWLGS